MIRSMTGFGRAARAFEQRDISVEIKAVNHRYFELNARIPRMYLSLEDPIRNLLRRSILRGKIELNLSVTERESEMRQVHVNRPLLQQYINELRTAGEEVGLRDDLAVSTLLRLPDVVQSSSEERDMDEVWGEIRPVAEEALAAFLRQREGEGAHLAADILQKTAEIQTLCRTVEEHLPELTEAYQAKLRARMENLLGERVVDEGRILTEVAVFAEKTAVDEELVRLHAHVEALREMLEGQDSGGKKMDFLVQEMNREVNTLTSKIGDLNVTRIAIELKSLIEKIREQIQNIE